MKENQVVKIRRELKILILEKQKTCTTEKEKARALNEARQEINKKYGKDWRVRDIKYHDHPSIYDGHENGEHWMD